MGLLYGLLGSDNGYLSKPSFCCPSNLAILPIQPLQTRLMNIIDLSDETPHDEYGVLQLHHNGQVISAGYHDKPENIHDCISDNPIAERDTHLKYALTAGYEVEVQDGKNPCLILRKEGRKVTIFTYYHNSESIIVDAI